MKTLILTTLCFLLLASSSMAQQEAQAGDESIVLTNQTRTRVINPGRRIKLYGPPGTVAIKGKLVSMGDSITIRPDNDRQRTQLQKVAVTDVQAVGMRRLGWEIITLYYVCLGALVIGLTLTIGWYAAAGALGTVAMVALGMFLYYGSLVLISALLARPKFAMTKWKWVWRDNR